MNKEEAEKYLKKKGKPLKEKLVEKVMKEGRIFGDPIVECQ